MQIANNPSAQLALNQLNRNSNGLGKSLRKVATGQRIVSAGDNASDYGISEKMRVQIRALDQDVQNVQNGSTMLKIAHGGIQEIVNDLRTMKELAINAANDSNTDADRAIIQKEIEQRREAIDDIATWTNYNTKPLLDGTYYNKVIKSTSSDPNGVDDNITGLFDLPMTTMEKTGSIVGWFNGKQAYKVDAPRTSGDDDEESVGAVKLNFSKATINGRSANFPRDLHNQGFSILCQVAGCAAFCGFRFDADMPIGTGEMLGSIDTPVYSVGIKGAITPNLVARALFRGVANAAGIEDDEETDTISLQFAHTVTLTRSGNNYTIAQDYPYYYIYEGYKISNGDEVSSDIMKPVNNPLWIQHGTKSNQRINVFINDMHSKTLGIDRAKVTTVTDANNAIGLIDKAIDYSLHEITNIGAYLQRLEYTEANVISEDENVQGAESTIRDADMAKEMTEYTKNNVLSQAAQSMLAQANQNLSGVLSLLQ